MAKKSKVDLGKGFTRIYFVLTGIWIAIWLTYAFYGNLTRAWDVRNFLFNIAWPFPLYFFLKWIIAGFKK